MYHVRLLENSMQTVTCLENIYLVRLLECSMQTVTCLDLHVQALEPIVSMLRNAKSFFRHSLHYYFSPCFQVFLGAYVLCQHHLSPFLTCRLVALALIQNQYFRHDFKVHLAALFVSWPLIFPHIALQRVCADHNMYRLVYKNTAPLTRKLKRIVLSALAFFSFMPSGLLCCEGPFVSSALRRCDHISAPIGGGRQYLFPNSSIMSSIKQGGVNLTPDHLFRFVDHVDDMGCLAYPLEQNFVYADLTLASIVPFLSIPMVNKIARIHKIHFSSRWKLAKDELVNLFDGHSCINCTLYSSVLEPVLSPLIKKRKDSAKAFASLTKEEKSMRKKKDTKTDDLKHAFKSTFPPPPLSKELSETIIRQWCEKVKPSLLEESGCAVCGELVPISQLSRLKAIKRMLAILTASGVTRIERKSASQKVSEFRGPVLDYRCDKVCDNCRKNIRKGTVPRLALANNLWLGEVPSVLSDLNYVERLLVARIRHNCCFIKVASSGGLYTAPRVLLDSAGFHRIPADLSPGLSWCDKGQIGIFCLAESGRIRYIRAESTEFRHIFPLDKSGRVQQNLLDMSLEESTGIHWTQSTGIHWTHC